MSLNTVSKPEPLPFPRSLHRASACRSCGSIRSLLGRLHRQGRRKLDVTQVKLLQSHLGQRRMGLWCRLLLFPEQLRNRGENTLQHCPPYHYFLMQLTGEVHLRVPRAPGNCRLGASTLVWDGQLLGHHATSILPHIGNLGWFLLLLSVYLHNFISCAEFLILQQHNKKQCELAGLGVWFAAGLSLPITESFSIKYYTIIIFYRTWTCICICSSFVVAV